MPPWRSARVGAVVDRETSALSPLPLAVVLHIFSLLPLHVRLRCRAVCRGWRSVLSTRSLWTRLDVSEPNGILLVPNFDGRALDVLLRSASARAAGGVASLTVNSVFVSHHALLRVVAANARALRELRIVCEDKASWLELDALRELLRAAPQLHVLAVDAICTLEDVDAVCGALRNEAPFGPLRVKTLSALLEDADEAGVVAFAAAVGAHASLTGLELELAPLDTLAAADAVVDAVLARALQTVRFIECGFTPASAPALARLLGGGALTTLICEDVRALDVPAARVLAAALRANATLTSLTLGNAGVFDDPAAAAVLLGALHGHASLRMLALFDNLLDDEDGDAVAAGAALGALVAANAPSLTHLDVAFCDLGDDGMRPLLEALPQNTHLRSLECYGNGMSDAFARDVLLPAVRANASLRRLDVRELGSAQEAEQLVLRRAFAP
jgi:hypothetical protein